MVDKIIIDLQQLVQSLDSLRADRIELALDNADSPQAFYQLGEAAAYEDSRMKLVDILICSMQEAKK